jgi:methylenetetrahydrofolate reductase (NADPH)
VPHIAARLVSGPDHVEKIAATITEHGFTELFIVGGDPDPVGPYADGASLMRDLLPQCSTVRTVGFPSYPDHHVAIPDAALDQALLDKQTIVTDLGLAGFASTQMCFDAKKIETWLAGQRARGFTLPVHLGVPGAVERARLLSLGTRLGIGSSLRYLRKNTGAILRIFSPKSYDPNKLINPVARRAAELNIVGLHVFTFNSIESTAAWQRESLA